MTFAWTDENLELLTSYIGADMPRGEIARLMDTTIGTITGKAYRLKITPASVSATQQKRIEIERQKRELREQLERERDNRRRAAQMQSNSDLCANKHCGKDRDRPRGTKQPGHRFGLCSTCDQVVIAERAVA